MIRPAALVVQGVGEDFGEVAHGSGLYDVVKGKVWRCDRVSMSSISADGMIVTSTATR